MLALYCVNVAKLEFVFLRFLVPGEALAQDWPQKTSAQGLEDKSEGEQPCFRSQV